ANASACQFSARTTHPNRLQELWSLGTSHAAIGYSGIFTTTFVTRSWINSSACNTVITVVDGCAAELRLPIWRSKALNCSLVMMFAERQISTTSDSFRSDAKSSYIAIVGAFAFLWSPGYRLGYSALNSASLCF